MIVFYRFRKSSTLFDLETICSKSIFLKGQGVMNTKFSMVGRGRGISDIAGY